VSDEPEHSDRQDREGPLPFADVVRILREHAEAPDAPADVRALGELAYRALSGRPPADDAAAVEPVGALRPSCPPGLAYLVMRCLEPEPADRWRSMEEIRSLLAGMVTPAPASEAEHLCRQGRYLWRQRGDGLRRGLERFERAAELDPDHAPARVGVADSCALLAVYGHEPPGSVVPRALAAAGRALELEPELAEAHASMGFLRLVGSWDWKAADRHLSRALELQPDGVRAACWHALGLLCAEGRVEAAVEACQRAAESHPGSARANGALGRMLACAGRHGEGVAYLRRAVELDSAWVHHRRLGLALSLWDRHGEAEEVLTFALELSRRHPWALSALGRVLAAAGDAHRAAEILDELIADGAQPSPVARLASALGRVDVAIEWLQRALDERDPALILLRLPEGPAGWEPRTAADPRLRAFWAEMELG